MKIALCILVVVYLIITALITPKMHRQFGGDGSWVGSFFVSLFWPLMLVMNLADREK